MSDQQNWFRLNASRFSGQLLFDEPLSRHTYYRIGGPAAVLAMPKSREDLDWLAEGIHATGIRVFVAGAGSNLLVSDAGFPGLIIRASRLDIGIEARGNLLYTGGSVAISTLLRRAAQEGWGGLEFLTGIPGSVGGCVFMNAGTHLGESKDRLRKVQVFSFADSGVQEFSGPELKFEYRKNLFLPSPSIVLSAEWEIDRKSPSEVKEILDLTLARRKATQPIDFPSCGSVFKNPKEHGISAWQVIDRLGLRGHRIGDAQFAEKHSNFIINLGQAKAADVKALIDLAKARAEKELGIVLQEEVIWVGEPIGIPTFMPAAT